MAYKALASPPTLEWRVSGETIPARGCVVSAVVREAPAAAKAMVKAREATARAEALSPTLPPSWPGRICQDS